MKTSQVKKYEKIENKSEIEIHSQNKNNHVL